MSGLAKGLNGFSQVTLWLAVLLTPFVALAGGLGFQVTLCLTGTSAILAWAADRTGVEYLRASWPFFLLAFMTWALISSLWSEHGGMSAYLLFGLLIPLLFVPLVVMRLPKRAIQPLIWTIIGIGVLGVALLLFDSATGYAISLMVDPVKPGGDPVFRLGQAEMSVGRGQVSYTQLFWPIAGLTLLNIKRGWALVAIIFLGLIASARLNFLDVVGLTLIFASCVAVLAWRRPSWGLRVAFCIAISSIVFAPLIGTISDLANLEFMRKMPLSWEHRIRMWSYSEELIRQAPLIGHGFDSSRVFNQLTFRAPDGRDIMVMSMHPHNIGLQIWLETGLVGVVLATGFLLSLMKVAFTTCQSSARAFAAAGLVVAVAANGAVTIGVWQHWWWALIVLSASLIILIPSEVKMNETSNLATV